MAKKIYSLFFILTLVLVGFTQAQVDTIYFNNKLSNEGAKPQPYYQPMVIKTSPTAFLGGGIFPLTSEYRIVVEIATAKKQTDQVSISYLGKNILLGAAERASGFTSTDVFKVSGWRLQYAHKFFLIRKKKYAPYGFYVGPHFSYANAHVSLGLNRHYNKTYYDFKHFNANLLIGVQMGKLNRLTLDIYAGIGYKNNLLFYHATSFNYYQLDTKEFGDLYNSHLNAFFGVNLGYSL
jgi:hypothetical protein